MTLAPLVWKELNTAMSRSPQKLVGTFYKRVADGIVKLLDATGLLHGYSFNSWSDVVAYDNAFVEEWLLSPQTSLYYSLQVMGDTQDKTNAYAALDQDEVDDYLKDILDNPITCDCQE